MCCPERLSLGNDYTQGFGVQKGACFQNPKSTVLGLKGDNSNGVTSLQQLKIDDLTKIKAIISSCLDFHPKILEENDCASCEEKDAKSALRIAWDGLNFYETFKGLEHLGYERFLSKYNLPYSIGLENLATKRLARVSSGARLLHEDHDSAPYVDKTLSGHLKAFNLQHIPIVGDGNCFFSAVGFHLASRLSSPETPQLIINHLNGIGITQKMSVAEIGQALRMLVVREWRGHREGTYRDFLPEHVDFHAESINFQQSGYFTGDLGDLMPMAMANVLRIPIIIITSEVHTPLINVCPEEAVLHNVPLFLAYNHLGVGHYDAAVTVDART